MESSPRPERSREAAQSKPRPERSREAAQSKDPVPSAAPADILKKRRSSLAQRLEGIGAAILLAASALGGWLGRLVGPRLGVTKRARINLRRALPELGAAGERRAMREMWDNLGRVIAEYPHLDAFRIYEPGGRVEFVGEEHVEPLLAAGTPIIFISAHFGNWE